MAGCTWGEAWGGGPKICSINTVLIQRHKQMRNGFEATLPFSSGAIGLRLSIWINRHSLAKLKMGVSYVRTQSPISTQPGSIPTLLGLSTRRSACYDHTMRCPTPPRP